MSISYGGDTITDSSGGVLRPISSVFRNRIINGAMVIDQRNAGASVTPNNSYTLDRWSTENSQTGKFTVQQTTTAPTGFSNSLKVTSSSAYTVLTGDYFALFQNIEGYNTADLAWGTASAKTVTLSFQIYSSLTGTFGGALSNSSGNRSYPFTYTVSSANTWTSISVTIAGDTSGTWGTTNGIGIQVQFGLGVGSTYSGTAGSWAGTLYVSATGATSVVGTSGATFYITGVQLEVGSSATGFEYVNYQTSLANCQRYYEQWNIATGNWQYVALAFAWSGSGVRTVLQYQWKRANPTCTISGTLNWANSGKTSTLSSGYAFDNPGLNTALLYNDSASGLTVGQAYQVSSGSSATISFSSEL